MSVVRWARCIFGKRQGDGRESDLCKEIKIWSQLCYFSHAGRNVFTLSRNDTFILKQKEAAGWI